MARAGADRKPCVKCGFILPKYPGRYPSKCPSCDSPFDFSRAELDLDGEEDEDEDDA